MSSAPASQPATPNPEKESELIYGLESHPPFGSSLLAALQHILAMVLSVMAPPAIVAGALGVPPEAIAYLVSMSLLFAGIGIWFQVSRPFGIGSGMLSIQATSFAFPYLKSQGQTDGKKSYGRFVDLMISYEKMQASE